MKSPGLFAISGVKNSGKTTFCEKLIPALAALGLRAAVIKHDGHEFEADVPGTDSSRCFAAGAVGTAVFSATKFCAVRRCNGVKSAVSLPVVDMSTSRFSVCSVSCAAAASVSVYAPLVTRIAGVISQLSCAPYDE